jgi:hypothetical protein
MEMQIFELTNSAVFVQLKHPDTDLLLFDPGPDGKDDPEKPVGVEVYGADSDQFKKHRRRAMDMGIEARSKRKTINAEKIDNESEKTLAACISKIVNISWKGVKLEAPRDCALLIQAMPWAAEQIDEAMGDRVRFMPALSKS